jgi:hypothetical protein
MENVIGYYGTDEEEMEMVCLLCSADSDVAIDIDNPVTLDGYPDGFTCGECWGTVNPNGTVENRVGE